MRLATVVEYGTAHEVVVRDDRCLALALPGSPRRTLHARARGALDAEARRDLAAWVDASSDAGWRPLDERRPRPAVPSPARSTRSATTTGPAGEPTTRAPRGRWSTASALVGRRLGRGRRVGPRRCRERDAEKRARRRHRRPATDVEGRTPWPTSSATRWSTTSRRATLARRRPMAAGQVDGRVLPGRPLDRHRRRARPARPRASPARVNGVADPGRPTARRCASRSRDHLFLSRHVELRPGDLIATGTPARLQGPIGPDDHLQEGDVVVCRIEGIGELPTTVD